MKIADDFGDINRRAKDLADGKLPDFGAHVKTCKHCNDSGWVTVTRNGVQSWEECVMCRNPNGNPMTVVQDLASTDAIWPDFSYFQGP